jgi:predicted nucleic acid-binding Zn ribbon protein
MEENMSLPIYHFHWCEHCGTSSIPQNTRICLNCERHYPEQKNTDLTSAIFLITGLIALAIWVVWLVVIE